MKKWMLLILLLLPSWVWGCNCELCINAALKGLDSNYVYQKSARITNIPHPRDSMCYTLVLSAGVEYQLSVFIRNAGRNKWGRVHSKLFKSKWVKDDFLNLYEVRKWELNEGTQYSKMNYIASSTGIYRLHFYLPEYTCGAFVLGFNKHIDKWVFKFKKHKEQRRNYPSKSYLQTHYAKQDPDGYIQLEYGSDFSWNYKLLVEGKSNQEIEQALQKAIYQKYQIHVKVKARYGLRGP